MDYRNAIILITGGSSGIGRALVERFLREGATVIACGRDEAKLQGLKAQHPSVEIRPCDITSSDEVKTLIAFLTQGYGRLDILVNNAGVIEQVAMLTGNVDDEAIAREIATNLTAPILLTRRLLPLLQRSHSPMILMVTSGYALLPAERAPTYSATKAGLRSFTQALRYQLAHTSIRVVETLPPLVDTPSTAALQRTKMAPAAVVDATLRAIAQGRVEIFVGEIRWLPLLMRIAPRFAARLIAKT
ncbi:MAG: SDR family NAD(P)-dependent oxidoreductase [Beggiatoa sp.]|nr:SDR family NAD(P)-dependent oxidoreductase [Beggiatoa sp.]